MFFWITNKFNYWIKYSIKITINIICILFNIDGIKTYDAIGCKKCNNSGYLERIGIFEVLNIDDDVKEMVMDGKSSIEIRRKAMEKGYRPLVVDGINKVLKGFTTLEELNKKLVIYNNF